MALRSTFVLAVLLLSASPLIADSFAEPPAGRSPVQEDSDNERPLPAIDLSGEWRMFLPAGWERTVQLERLGENRYYIHPPYVMKGTYELRGRELAFVNENRLEGAADPLPETEAAGAERDNAKFVWTVRSAYLMTLTSSAGGYRDAVLFRSNGREN